MLQNSAIRSTPAGSLFLCAVPPRRVWSPPARVVRKFVRRAKVGADTGTQAGDAPAVLAGEARLRIELAHSGNHLQAAPNQSGQVNSVVNQAVTSEPTFSPKTTRRIFPGSFILKMIMGRLLSLQRLTAVVSITFNPNRRISM